MRSRVLEQPSTPLFPIEECRAQCEVVPYDEDSDGNLSHPDDALLLGYLAAAVAAAEAFTGLSIVVRTYEAALTYYPVGPIDIPNPPLVSLDSFTTGTGSDSVDNDPGTWLLDDFSQPARIFSTATCWPQITPPAAPNNIRIRYTAGYPADSDGSTVPMNIKQAIMLTMADWYKNREDSNDVQTYNIPNSAEALLRPMRVLLGMA